MITLTLTTEQFEEIYDAVRDLPDIYKSELKENGDEPDAAHIDLYAPPLFERTSHDTHLLFN